MVYLPMADLGSFCKHNSSYNTKTNHTFACRGEAPVATEATLQREGAVVTTKPQLWLTVVGGGWTFNNIISLGERVGGGASR